MVDCSDFAQIYVSTSSHDDYFPKIPPKNGEQDTI